MSEKIIVLDDEITFAAVVRDMLLDVGYQVMVCTDPEEAMRLVVSADVGLVISDYQMPGMDGSEVLLKARELRPSIPLIMISGYMNAPELLKVANMGVTLALEKPFDSDELLAAVKQFVKPGQGSGAAANVREAILPKGLSYREVALSLLKHGWNAENTSMSLLTFFLNHVWENQESLDKMLRAFTRDLTEQERGTYAIESSGFSFDEELPQDLTLAQMRECQQARLQAQMDVLTGSGSAQELSA